MPAHPSTPDPPPAPVPAPAPAGSRLPWWALALPVLAFVALLGLMADPAQAQPRGDEPALGVVVEHLAHLLAA